MNDLMILASHQARMSYRDRMRTQLPAIAAWYHQPGSPGTSPKICTTRDVFQARLDS